MTEEKQREYIITEQQKFDLRRHLDNGTYWAVVDILNALRPYDIDAVRKDERGRLITKLKTEVIPRIAKMNDEGIRMIYALVLEGELNELSCDSQDGGSE